jgi:hypothetical protein
MKTKELLKEIKGVFKPPIKRYYFGIAKQGAPYFVPRRFITNVELGWKDKYHVPAFEWVPQVHIKLLGLQFCIWWNAPDRNNDLYYEMIIWWLNYCDKDIKRAKETWDWIDGQTHKSTWNDNYLI